MLHEPSLKSILSRAAEGRWIIDTGAAQFRLPAGEGSDATAPLLGVRSTDGIWRGRGRLILPDAQRVRCRTTDILEAGPLQVRLRISYQLTDRTEFSYTFTAHAG